MKKSLVALAVLAASGASFAQVTVSGALAAGFQANVNGTTRTSTTAGSTEASGFGVDTANIDFKAAEDVGGGVKVAATMGLTNMVRGAAAQTGAGQQSLAFGPANTSLAISGDFGRITFATGLGSDYLTSPGNVAAVGGTYMYGRVFGDRSVSDSIAYALPAMGPLAVTLTYSEPDNLVGLGANSSGATTTTGGSGVRNYSISLRYTDGPLIADGAYYGYDTNFDAGPTNDRNNDRMRVRGSLAYDFGVARVGFGMDQRSKVAGTRTDTGLAISVPLGALTLGANWAQRQYAGNFLYTNTIGTPAAVKNDTFNGYGLKATYALSKRTSIAADYSNWLADRATNVIGTNNITSADNSSQYNLLMIHSF